MLRNISEVLSRDLQLEQQQCYGLHSQNPCMLPTAKRLMSYHAPVVTRAYAPHDAHLRVSTLIMRWRRDTAAASVQQLHNLSHPTCVKASPYRWWPAQTCRSLVLQARVSRAASMHAWLARPWPWSTLHVAD
jgi:hypothetical protein